MKTKKAIILIMSIISISITTQVFGWLQYSTYEACNIVNSGIAWLLRTIAFIIIISYITGAIQYIKRSKQDQKSKIKNLLTWLIICIVQVAFLLAGSVWVTEIGMETYWSSGQRYQFNENDGYISNSIRIVAFIAILAYINTTLIYVAKSKQEKIRKAENVIKLQIITSAIVAVLLIFARNW